MTPVVVLIETGTRCSNRTLLRARQRAARLQAEIGVRVTAVVGSTEGGEREAFGVRIVPSRELAAWLGGPA